MSLRRGDISDVKGKAPRQTISVRAKRDSPSLLLYDELPAWYQDNEFIKSGYRPVSLSVSRSLRSLSYLHNETVNIYSHLLPALATVSAAAVADRTFISSYPLATEWDRLIFGFYLLTVLTCMTLSASYHTLMNHSANYSDLWGRIDYCGIMVLIFGDFVTGIYLGLYCEPGLQSLYWSMISVFTAATAFVVLNSTFQSRRYRLLRLSCFTATGLSAFAPIVHALRIFPADQLAKQSGLHYYYMEGAIVLLAAAIYATHFPEAWRPGHHDIWGSSHQIFHVLTVLATVVHLTGIKSAYEYNYLNRRC